VARRKRDDGESAPRFGGELEVAPSALKGRKAGEAATVRWVARNVDNPEPDPAECPDPFAWTLLRMCKRSPDFTLFFVERLWSKLIPSRTQMDPSQQRTTDGKPTIELIEKIQAMRDEAIGPRDLDQGMVGLTSFEDYDPEEDA